MVLNSLFFLGVAGVAYALARLFVAVDNAVERRKVNDTKSITENSYLLKYELYREDLKGGEK